jgi:hypothetical protein
LLRSVEQSEQDDGGQTRGVTEVAANTMEVSG